MFMLRKPTDAQMRDYLEGQAEEPYSYGPVGCTREVPAPRRGWKVDHCRVLLGTGREAFEAACEAIRRWKMFPPEMATLFGAADPAPGLIVGVLYRARVACCWMLMPARIVYTIQDSIDRPQGPVHRFGFAYGTLPDHPERGEERFLVEWNEGDDAVWYDLLPVSQPAHWLARIGYPYARYEQARFRRLSGQAMQRAVSTQQGAALRTVSR